jgi:hypothetical protein
MTEQIYTEEQARSFLALAIRDQQCASLLNTLAGGGVAMVDADDNGHPFLVLVDGDTFGKWYDQQFPNTEESQDA